MSTLRTILGVSLIAAASTAAVAESVLLEDGSPMSYLANFSDPGIDASWFLEEFVEVDIPFLERERSIRIAELHKLMKRPDVPTSEKYRRISEAYQIELEYGHTIEAYEGEMDVGGESRTVAFLRFGRLGLYYMTLDGHEIGFWDNTADEWVALDDEYRLPLDQAIRIARKQLPPDLIRLPIPAPEKRS